MRRAPLDYLDLDVWLVARDGGRGYEAYTTAEPYFRLSEGDLRTLEHNCARELALYAMTDGHDARFRVEASLLPETRPAPRYPGHFPTEPGMRLAGRLSVIDVMVPGGRSMMPPVAIPAGGRAAA